MPEVVEGVKHANAKVQTMRVFGVQLPQNVDFQFGRFPVLVDIFDDFQSVTLGPVFGRHVSDFGYFAEGAFAESRHDFVAV